MTVRNGLNGKASDENHEFEAASDDPTRAAYLAWLEREVQRLLNAQVAELGDLSRALLSAGRLDAPALKQATTSVLNSISTALGFLDVLAGADFGKAGDPSVVNEFMLKLEAVMDAHAAIQKRALQGIYKLDLTAASFCPECNTFTSTPEVPTCPSGHDCIHGQDIKEYFIQRFFTRKVRVDKDLLFTRDKAFKARAHAFPVAEGRKRFMLEVLDDQAVLDGGSTYNVLVMLENPRFVYRPEIEAPSCKRCSRELDFAGTVARDGTACEEWRCPGCGTVLHTGYVDAWRIPGRSE